jgi:hypothetical protein
LQDVQLLLKLSFFPLRAPLSASLSDLFFHRGTEDFIKVVALGTDRVAQRDFTRTVGGCHLPTVNLALN